MPSMDIAALDAQIEAHLAPYDQAVQQLDEIPGIGPVAAAIIIAEIGLDMSRFPTAGHLCSWAKLSLGIKSSAGKSKGSGSTGHGDRYLARVLGEAAVMAGRSDTFLGDRYRMARLENPDSVTAVRDDLPTEPDDYALGARLDPRGARESPTRTPDRGRGGSAWPAWGDEVP